ncbi:DUF4349 domain-containing protein [Chloroflexus sp.]|uniref:DUF4349 domain-containing protein n=1 Tax=Chloroflexus sp. TaxID=1904827 RepID=UPI002ADD9E59|nr:DUF4349 domain-containing protein [Chloroflexus sp.]
MDRLKRFRVTFVIGIIVLLVGGAVVLFGQPGEMMLEEPAFVAIPTPASMLSGAPVSAQRDTASFAGGVSSGEAAIGSEAAVQRLIVKNASIALEVTDVLAAEQVLRQKAEALGGFVASVETYGSGEDLRVTIVLRVPDEHFEAVLRDTEGLASKVLRRSVSGSDVTEEYVDLEARLRNLEATNARLLDLLSRTQNVNDALMVNQALTEIQEQIEWIKGRMQYLEQSAAMSTITVELLPVPSPTPIIEEDTWQPLEVARIALRNLIQLGQTLANAVIVFLVWTPVWLPLVLLAIWARRRLWQRT